MYEAAMMHRARLKGRGDGISETVELATPVVAESKSPVEKLELLSFLASFTRKTRRLLSFSRARRKRQ
jgi:hypothetical protein